MLPALRCCKRVRIRQVRAILLLTRRPIRERLANARAFAMAVGAHTTAAGVLDAAAGVGAFSDDRRVRISIAEVMSDSDRVNGMR